MVFLPCASLFISDARWKEPAVGSLSGIRKNSKTVRYVLDILSYRDV